MVKVVVTGSDGQLGKTFAEVVSGLDAISFDFKTSNELDITCSDHLRTLLKKDTMISVSIVRHIRMLNRQRNPRI